jgi:hexaprenyl-diphosphate synthase
MSSRLSSRVVLLCDINAPQCFRRRSFPSTYYRISLYLPQHHRNQSTWADTLSSASKLVQDPESISAKLPNNLPFPSIINPLKLVAPEMTSLTSNIRMLLGSGHPTLAKVAKYYISSEGGKHIRPLIVLLVSKALSYNRPNIISERQDQDIPLSPTRILNDENPEHPMFDADAPRSGGITPSQRRLAEITEMIHAASLLHDDVIDASLTRRNNPSCVSVFGNKMSILGGDFLLGRASVALARLRNAEVIELLATVIANLVEGEFMQLKNIQNDGSDEKESAIDYYLRKTYLKTASLISKSCRAAAVLGGSAPELTDKAYSFGRNLGLAFQVDPSMELTVVG